jgi:manganese oxidase
VGPGSRDEARDGKEDPRYKVPGFPQDAGMMAPMTMAEMARFDKIPLTRGMRPGWPMSTMALMTNIRVLPPDLYDRVRSGKGEVRPGESVPGAATPAMKHMKGMKGMEGMKGMKGMKDMKDKNP